MTKADLIKAVAKKAYLTTSQAEAAINVLFQEVGTELKKKDGRVVIDEVLSLTNVVRPETRRHNPSKGRVVKIKKGRRIKLTVSQKFKKKL